MLNATLKHGPSGSAYLELSFSPSLEFVSLAARVGVGALIEQQLGQRRDRAEHVVHVVREPGRERPDGLHAVRMQHLLLIARELGLRAREPRAQLLELLAIGPSVNAA